jgi:hypothetical protein
VALPISCNLPTPWTLIVHLNFEKNFRVGGAICNKKEDVGIGTMTSSSIVSPSRHGWMDVHGHGLECPKISWALKKLVSFNC